MIEAVQLKKGNVIHVDGKMFRVVDIHLLTPGNKRSIIQTKLKNMKAGNVFDKRFRSNDKVEVAFLDQVKMEYLYSAGHEHVFMNEKTLDQVSLSEEILEGTMNFLVPNTEVTVQFYDNNPISVELPTTVNLKVVQTDAIVKGQTATNQYKTAVLETGLNIQVPPFIKEDELVKVDTRTGEYLSRAKE